MNVPPKSKVGTANFNVEPRFLHMMDAQTGVHRYTGLKPIGCGTAMSDQKAATVVTGDYVVKCVNQYKDHPLCEEQVRCHASFEGLPQAGHEQNCSCGACGYDFKCIQPATCGCKITKMNNKNDEPCVIM